MAEKIFHIYSTHSKFGWYLLTNSIAINFTYRGTGILVSIFMFPKVTSKMEKANSKGCLRLL